MRNWHCSMSCCSLLAAAAVTPIAVAVTAVVVVAEPNLAAVVESDLAAVAGPLVFQDSVILANAQLHVLPRTNCSQ